MCGGMLSDVVRSVCGWSGKDLIASCLQLGLVEDSDRPSVFPDQASVVDGPALCGFT